MKIPRLPNCCYCVELKLGTIVIAVVCIVLDCVGGGGGYAWGEGIVGTLCLVCYVLHLIGSILLLIGAILENVCLCILWILVTICLIIILIVVIILAAINGSQIGVIVYMICVICLYVYFWLVVFSFYAGSGGNTMGQ